MKIIEHNKLVRDRIPEIIMSKSKNPICETLGGEDYYIALKAKLIEEANEYIESDNIEELADLLEVMDAIVKYKGTSYEEIETIRLKKKEERGGFEDRVLLLRVEG